MKLFNTITASLLLCAGLVSCEMKDELRGSGEGSSEVGYLNLGVAVNASQNSVVSRAEVDNDGENVGVAVSADDFPVIITGVTNPEYSKEYESYAALRAENGGVVELPAGEYTVTAHSDAELTTQMSAPYYEGIQPFTITAGVNSSTNVECSMKNMKFQLTYTANFLAKFESWDITVRAGLGNILTFDETDKNPAAVYWLVGENISEINVHVSATPMGGGQAVEIERNLTKPAGGNSAYWTGADALTVQMEEQTTEDPTGILGSNILINASVTFDEEEEEVKVEVKPGDDTEEPGDGGDDNTDPEPEPQPELPTMTLPGTNGNITYTLNGDDMPATANVEINAPAGISSLLVTIDPGNDAFANTLSSLVDSGLNFTSGVEMVENPIITGVLSAFLEGQEIAAPAEGETSYSFPIHAFFTLMNVYGSTAPDSHVFKMILKDNAGETVEEELSVTINPAE